MIDYMMLFKVAVILFWVYASYRVVKLLWKGG